MAHKHNVDVRKSEIDAVAAEKLEAERQATAMAEEQAKLANGGKAASGDQGVDKNGSGNVEAVKNDGSADVPVKQEAVKSEKAEVTKQSLPLLLTPVFKGQGRRQLRKHRDFGAFFPRVAEITHGQAEGASSFVRA